jgi:hypothetical protein
LVIFDPACHLRKQESDHQASDTKRGNSAAATILKETSFV